MLTNSVSISSKRLKKNSFKTCSICRKCCSITFSSKLYPPFFFLKLIKNKLVMYKFNFVL